LNLIQNIESVKPKEISCNVKGNSPQF